MKNKIFKCYTDSQHGWVAVKRAELAQLGLLDKISRWSYQKGSTVYLEGDADLTLFFKTFEAHYGTPPQIGKSIYSNYSPIRSYESYKNETV